MAPLNVQRPSVTHRPCYSTGMLYAVPVPDDRQWRIDKLDAPRRKRDPGVTDSIVAPYRHSNSSSGAGTGCRISGRPIARRFITMNILYYGVCGALGWPPLRAGPRPPPCGECYVRAQKPNCQTPLEPGGKKAGDRSERRRTRYGTFCVLLRTDDATLPTRSETHHPSETHANIANLGRNELHATRTTQAVIKSSSGPWPVLGVPMKVAASHIPRSGLAAETVAFGPHAPSACRGPAI